MLLNHPEDQYIMVGTINTRYCFVGNQVNLKKVVCWPSTLAMMQIRRGPSTDRLRAFYGEERSPSSWVSKIVMLDYIELCADSICMNAISAQSNH